MSTLTPAASASGAEWVAPIKTATAPFVVTDLFASSAGLAYSGRIPDSTGDSAVVYRAVSAAEDTVAATGHVQLVGVSGSWVLYEVDHLQEPDELDFVNLRTGQVAHQRGVAVANLGGRALVYRPRGFFVVRSHNGDSFRIPSPRGQLDGGPIADARGFAVWTARFGPGAPDHNRYRLYYCALKSRSCRLLAAADDGPHPGGGTALTAHTVTWSVNNWFYRVHRSGGPVTRTAAPSGTKVIAATDGWTASLVHGTATMQTSTGNHRVALSRVTAITSDGSELIAVGGDPDHASVYRVSPSGVVTRLFAVHEVPYVMQGECMGVGRLYYQDDSAAVPPLLARSFTSDGGSISVGGESRLSGSAFFGCSASDGYVARYDRAAGHWQVVVQTPSGQTKRFAVPHQPQRYGMTGNLEMSGPRLIVGWQRPSGYWHNELIDVSTHRVTTIASPYPSGAYVWGPDLVWVDRNHQLWRRDLTEPVSPSNPEVIYRKGDAGGGAPGTPQMFGDWVLISWGYASSMAFNLVTGEHLKFARDSARLIDGGVIYATSTFDLSAPPSTMKLLPLTGADHTRVSLPDYFRGALTAEHVVGYVGDDQLLHLAPMPVDTPGQPRVLYVTPAGTFDRSRSASYHLEIDATKAIGAWQATIRDRGGNLVRTWQGTQAPDGSIDLTWNGTNALGLPVADGNYVLTWSGSASDGSGSLSAAAASGPPATRIAVQG